MITIQIKKKLNVSAVINKKINVTAVFTPAIKTVYNVEYRIADAPASGNYETLSGAINGSNDVFTVPGGAYVPDKVLFHVNGKLEPRAFQQLDPSAGEIKTLFIPKPNVHTIQVIFIEP